MFYSHFSHNHYVLSKKCVLIWTVFHITKITLTVIVTFWRIGD